MRNGKIVGRGFNQSKSNAKLRKHGYYSTHAETAAIMDAKTGDTLVVVRVSRKNGSYVCSKPCDKCLSFAKEHGIKKIYFCNIDGKVEMVKI